MSLYMAAGVVALASSLGTARTASQILSAISIIRTVYPNAAEKVINTISDLDIEATVTTIQTTIDTHQIGTKDYLIAREYVIKALQNVKFQLETIKFKTEKYNRGWKQYYKKLDLSKEEVKLKIGMKVLKSRFKRMMDLKLLMGTARTFLPVENRMKLMNKSD